MGGILWRRQLLGFLMLCAAVGWAERWGLERAGTEGAPPALWFGLEVDGVLTWEADLQAARQAAQGCAGDPSVAPGEVLVVERGPEGCRVSRRQALAIQRLRLGLRLHVNEESQDGLQVIAGIGPKTAAAIVDARPFEDLEALERVRGIGPSRRAALSRYLTVLPRPRPGAPPPDASALQTP